MPTGNLLLLRRAKVVPQQRLQTSKPKLLKTERATLARPDLASQQLAQKLLTEDNQVSARNPKLSRNEPNSMFFGYIFISLSMFN